MSLTDEDRKKNDEKHEERGKHLVVQTVEFEQEGQEECEKDMNVEKTLQLSYVFLLKLIPMRMQHFVDLITADCDCSVNS